MILVETREEVENLIKKLEQSLEILKQKDTKLSAYPLLKTKYNIFIDVCKRWPFNDVDDGELKDKILDLINLSNKCVRIVNMSKIV